MKKCISLLAKLSYQGDIKKLRGKILNIYEIREQIVTVRGKFQRKKVYKKITYFCAQRD